MMLLEKKSSANSGNFPDNCKVYHDARLLLELYSKVSWRLGESLNELDEECSETDNKHLYDLIDSLIDVDTQIDKNRFERRMQSIEESKSLIELVDRVITKLKNYPKNGELYFQILKKVYISNQSVKSCEDQLLEMLHISRSTYYREKKKAILLFGAILWGFAFSDVFNIITNWL